MFEGNYFFTTKNIVKFSPASGTQWVNFIDNETRQITTIQINKILYHQWEPNNTA